MDDLEALKVHVKKLSAKAMQLKMDLHDLSEELPINWESIPEVAERTYRAFAELIEKRSELERLQGE